MNNCTMKILKEVEKPNKTTKHRRTYPVIRLGFRSGMPQIKPRTLLLHQPVQNVQATITEVH
jgi:hypothetical protein